MDRLAFEQMRFTYRREIRVDSEWVIMYRLAMLSKVEPVYYDCCINSCIAFLGQFELHEYCPICKQARYDGSGHARRLFMYLPIIPRLQALFRKPEVIESLSYRHNYVHHPGQIRDVFDAQHYRSLLRKKVVVDGVTQPYRYFSGEHDITFAIATDGYLLFKRRRSGPSATPILFQLYNFPPQIRARFASFFCLGLIPGPHPPVDYASFMVPLDSECVKLAFGVPTYDPIKGDIFDLRAYGIQVHGDLHAISKMMCMKGVNGFSPCRDCEITGVRMIGRGRTTYYVPLQTPDVSHQTRPSFDPRALPLRNKKHFDDILEQLAAPMTKGQRKDLEILHGIKGPTALRRVESMNPSKSYPWEWLHLFCENNIKNLVQLWMGKFKGLKSGSENYEIGEEQWKEIGRETADTVRDIPASFVRVLGNIAEDRSSFTAESWGFWFMHVAPIVMRGRFSDDKYYHHMCALGSIMKTTLKYELTTDEVDNLEEDSIDWVRKYEEYVYVQYVGARAHAYSRYYYQYREDRLSTCLLTVHGLLHIANDIRVCGPMWASWTFYLERYCGKLQEALHSRVYPWSNLNSWILRTSYLQTLAVRYDIEDELSVVGTHADDGPRRNERSYPGCASVNWHLLHY